MIHNLKPYPAYKDSGVPWLGEVPEHWDVKRQRNVAQMFVSNIDKHSSESEKPVRLCNYVDVYKNERITDSIPFMHVTASQEEIEKFRLQIGDVIITKDSEMWNDIGVPALVEYEAPDLVCGYHLAILRPRDGLISGFYFLRALQSQGVESQYYVSANGVTRYGLSHDAIKSVLVPVPPLSEQSTIVHYLDHIDRRIRRYIRAKQKLIKLLEEQKQAIIHQAVTRGLDPNVKLKPSGVEWLGDVPEHWNLLRLKDAVFQIVDTEHKTAPFYENGKYLVVRTSNVKDGQLLLSDAKYTDEAGFKEWSKRGLPEPGDILFTREAPAGEACLVPKDLPLCLGQRMVLFRVNPEVLISQFGLYSIYGGAAAEFIRQLSLGSTVPHFNMFDIACIPMLLPPICEQQTIASFLNMESEKFAETVDRTHREISLLREYRTRLIADVVTGKLDVRGAAANLPEEAEETETFDDSVAEDELENDEIGDQAGELEEEVLV